VRQAPHRFWRPVTLALGFVISAAIAGVVHDMLQQESAAQHEIARQSLAAGLESHVERELGFFRFLRGLYDSSESVSETEFQRFARIETAVRDRAWWISIAWAPRTRIAPNVSARSAFSNDAFPVTYLEPAGSGDGKLADLAADPADRAVMQQAVETLQLAVTPPRMMTLNGHSGMAVRAFTPVFRSDQSGAPGRLQGFLVGTIMLDGFFNDFLDGGLTDANLALRIYDGKVAVFSSGKMRETVVASKLMLGGREWRLEVDGSVQPIETAFWLPALVFATGIALTALIYLRLLRADTEYRRIATEVGHATAELASANHRLAERSTTLQQVADDLRRTSQEAQFANAAKTVFLANMSHELRTPLNAIIGFSEMIASRALGNDSPRYVEYANDIRSSGRYLLSIIEDLLDMSRIELGQVQLKEEPASIAGLVADVVKFVTLRAREKNVTIREQGLDSLPRVKVDPKAMRQCLINLLTNAVKFSSNGGAIEILGAIEPGGGIALSVVDHGLGIKAEDLKRVFEPFWQNEAYRRQTKEGIGLGLAITKRLVEAHDGTIGVSSREGEGTTVTVRLPAQRLIRPKPQLTIVADQSGTAA